MTEIGEAPRKRRWWHWLKRIALWGIGVIVLVIFAATVREWFATRADARRFPQEGRSVNVGGFRLNIDCSGTARPGTPAVILESGAGVPAVGWKLVQPEIAKFTKVCSYDRAGYGWSDPPTDMQRTSLQGMKELHTLLQNASVPPPYVLVGHSLGGFNIRVFNGLYPSEVAGAVFVDSSHEDQMDRMPPTLKKMLEAQLKPPGWELKLVPFAVHTGMLRLIQAKSRGQNNLPAELGEEIEYLQRRTVFVETGAAEIRYFPESVRETRDSGNFGDKPLIVLTAGKFVDLPEIPKNEVDEFQQTWTHELQPQLAKLSTKGKQSIVANSDHMIPMEQPQAVVDAVREVVQAVTHAPQ